MAKRPPKEPNLHDDPTNSLGYLVRRASVKFGSALHKRLMTKKVTLGQWRFLRVLWLQEGMTQRKLSQLVGLREPSTVSALRKMEEKGLVTRAKSETDRRRIHVRLTAKAKRLRKTLMPFVVEVNRIALKGYSREEAAIGRRLLLLAIDNLTADTGDSAEPPEEHEEQG